LNVEDLSGGKVNQLTKDMESTTNIINHVNDFIYTIKNRTLKKGENILRNIHDKLLEIDRRKNLTYWFLSNRMDAIINNIEDLKKLCQVLQRSLSDTTTQRKQIENNISNLKLNMEKFMNNYKDDKKKINDAIRKTIRKTGKNLFNSIHKIGTKYVIYTMIMICMTLILKLKQ
jgi:predicted  nucleic acid-binding Zn-ribbon protein